MKLNLLYKIAFWISLLGMLVIISDFGFPQTDAIQVPLDIFYFIVLGIGVVASISRYLFKRKLFKIKVFIFDLLSVLFTFGMFYWFVFIGEPFETDLLLDNPIWVKIAVFLTFIREFSELEINFKRTVLNPA